MLRNTNVCLQDNGPLFQEYAEKEKLMSQPLRMLISSFELTNDSNYFTQSWEPYAQKLIASLSTPL